MNVTRDDVSKALINSRDYYIDKLQGDRSRLSRENDKLVALLSAKDQLSTAIQEVVAVELEKRVEHYRELDAEVERLRTVNAHLLRRISKLQKSRDYFKNAYKKGE